MDMKINILNENVKIPESILGLCNGDKLIAKILLNRGFTSISAINSILNDNLYIPTDPYEFPNMKQATARISSAIAKNEKICIYGDYDVDGVTSTVVLVETLRNFTSNVIYHVPNRFSEGYGMNSNVIKSLCLNDVNLIITCDCGISNIEEIKLAKELGMDVIITDHHNISDNLPPTDIIINPKLLPLDHKARDISGCSTAYFLCKAICENSNKNINTDTLLDMVGMSIVADVVPLTGENRYLLKKSMTRVFDKNRPGLKALIEISEKYGELSNEEDIAFALAPRINAAGRMESASLPVDLFLCDNYDRCKDIAQKIDILNQERKAMQQDMIEDAISIIEQEKKNQKILVIFNRYWHHGIIGITAGKICEMYKKPVILMTLKEDETTIVGSARSDDNVNIYQLIKACSNKLIKFGGHSQAAGLSINKQDMDSFIQEIENFADENLFIQEKITVDVDVKLEIGDITEDLYNRLCSLRPFGQGFIAPCFLSENVTILSDRKTEKNHHLMIIEGINQSRLPAVKWFGENINMQGKVGNIVYKIYKSSYKQSESLQLNIDYFKESFASPSPLFTGIFLDYRTIDPNQILLEFPNSIVYYEGLDVHCPIRNTFNRYNIKESDTLVFLSPPPNTQLFREIVSIATPKRLVISFYIAPDYSFKGFMYNLMGIIKYFIRNQSSISNIEDFTTRLCIEDTLLFAGLKYLKYLGKINYITDFDKRKIIFNTKCSVNEYYLKMQEKILKTALLEKDAYKQFIINLDTESFKKYLK